METATLKLHVKKLHNITEGKKNKNKPTDVMRVAAAITPSNSDSTQQLIADVKLLMAQATVLLSHKCHLLLCHLKF